MWKGHWHQALLVVQCNLFRVRRWPGPSHRTPQWCRGLPGSSWMWWCGSAPVQQCPTEEKTRRSCVSPKGLSPTLSPPNTLSVNGTGTAHNLKLYGFAVELDGPDLEVHADGTDVALCVRVILVEYKHTPSVTNTGWWAATAVTKDGGGGFKRFLCDKQRLTANRRRRQDFPTPESPIRSSLNK